MAGDWLTYAQAGERFGLSADAVRMRAHRLGWRVQPGNDGRTLVLVPEDAAVQPRRRSPERSSAHSGGRAPAQAADGSELAAATARVLLAEQRAEQAEQRADQAEKRADAADSDRRAAEARADAADADRRAAEVRADTLRERIEGLLTKFATAEADAKAANDRAWASGEQLAAVERRAEAESERADRAEASAAHERQDFLDVEVLTRRELDTLRERLAEAEKGREVAEAAVLQAAQTADEVLQTAAVRQRLGLIARLRAAWRGE
jgi:chromosome segregation ATPase